MRRLTSQGFPFRPGRVALTTHGYLSAPVTLSPRLGHPSSQPACQSLRPRGIGARCWWFWRASVIGRPTTLVIGASDAQTTAFGEVVPLLTTNNAFFAAREVTDSPITPVVGEPHASACSSMWPARSCHASVSLTRCLLGSQTSSNQCNKPEPTPTPTPAPEPEPTPVPHPLPPARPSRGTPVPHHWWDGPPAPAPCPTFASTCRPKRMYVRANK